MKRFILIDSYALIHRAYHALPPLTTKTGEVVNAVFGFASILIKTLNEFKPDYVAAAFDTAEPTFRHKEYKEYKATRKEAPEDLHIQVPRVKEVLKAFGIPVFEKSGYEADDVIAAISEKLKGKDIEVLILTGDMDTLQLVGGNIKVYSPKKGLSDPVIYNEKKVIERFGGLKPDQLNDYKGLRGDPSDNIPGVKGIGEKTAIALLNQFKNIENLYRAVDKGKAEGVSPSVVEKLRANEEMAFFSKKMATLDQKVPIDFNLSKSQFGKYDKEKLINLLKELGFASLIERLKSSGEQGNLLAVPPARPKKIKHIKVPEGLGWGNLNREIKKSREIFLAYSLKESGELESLVLESGGKIYLVSNDFSKLQEILSDEKIKKIGHDFKPFIKALARENMEIRGLDFDTMIAAYVLNPGERGYGVKRLAFNEFGELVPDDPLEFLLSQSGLIRRLKEVFSRRLKETESEKVFREIEMPLIPILAEMEMLGIKLDGKRLEEISRKIEKEMRSLEKNIYKSAGEEFNINSPQQLADILFMKLGIPGARKGGRIKKTPKGALSTEAGELERLRGQHEIIGCILKYRELSKIKSTYTDVLPGMADENQRIHTTFNQAGTATGRLSSSDPNLQNIPARGGWGDEIRRSFVAEKRFKLVSADYSQIHLRIIAALANDRKMIKAFEEGLDIHKFTAAEINNVPIGKVTPQMRFAAKELNFGILYGMGSQSFSEAANISKKEAEQFISEYLGDFSGVARYIEELKKEARQKGFAATIFGRRRYLPDLESPNFMLRAQAERIAVNMPIQGLEADIMKLAMIAVKKWIEEKNYSSKIRMVLQVHDELLFEIDEGVAEKTISEIIGIMEGVIKLKAPIIAEAKIGNNWGKLEKHA